VKFFIEAADSMSYVRDPAAVSKLTGQPVNTWSEEWPIETTPALIDALPHLSRCSGWKGEMGKTAWEQLRLKFLTFSCKEMLYVDQ